jgi:hypothetical protein
MGGCRKDIFWKIVQVIGVVRNEGQKRSREEHTKAARSSSPT